MKDNNVSRIEELFADVRSGLTELRRTLEAIIGDIDAGKYVSSNMIETLSGSMESYRRQAAALETIGEELSVPIGSSIDAIEETIGAYRDRSNTERQQQIILEYFRLTAEAEDIYEQLEASKRRLMEKCVSTPVEAVTEMLQPYDKAVYFVQNPDQRLRGAQFKEVENTIGTDLTLDIIQHDIVYDPTLDVSVYMDGSCALLSVSTTEDRSEDEAEPDDVETESATSMTDQPIPLDEKPPEAADNLFFELLDDQPASALKASAYRKLATQKPGVVTIMHYLAEAKLCETDLEDEEYYRRFIATDAFDSLCAQGYIARLRVASPIIERTYYTLSDKGWACYINQDVVRMLKNEFKHPSTGKSIDYSMPKPLCISTEQWDSATALQAAALRAYFTSKHQNVLICISDAVRGSVFGMAIGNDGMTVLPALTCSEEILAEMVKIIRPESGSKEADRTTVFIVATAHDIAPLCDALVLTDDERSSIQFRVFSENFALYGADGSLNSEEGSTIPVTVVSGDVEEEAAAEEIPELSAFAALLEAKQAFIPDDIQWGSVEQEISHAEDKKLSSSGFVSDLRKGNESACKTILKMARVVLLHNHTSGTRIHFAKKNMDTIFLAQGNMSALFYGHGNMSRNGNLFTIHSSKNLESLPMPPRVPHCMPLGFPVPLAKGTKRLA